MPTPSPLLDHRSFQALQDRLQELATHHLPDWTPPPEGDAGTMLQHAFARLLEITLERLNRVPEKNRLAFLDTMGVDLLPPSAARVPLTFGLTAGTAATRVPKGSRVATEPSGGQAAATFETEAELTVIPAQITSGFTIDPIWDKYRSQTAALAGAEPHGFTPLVGATPLAHVLYLGDATMLKIVKAVIDVDVKWEQDDLSLDTLRQVLGALTWEVSHLGQPVALSPSPTSTSLSGPAQGGMLSLNLAETAHLQAGDTIRLGE